MPEFIKETLIEAPASQVFAFHERPDALSQLVPPWEKVTVEKPPESLAVGTEVILVNHLGPLKLQWVARHTGYEPPLMFQDIQESGPFRKWVHTHRVIPVDDQKSLLRDEVVYELPMGWLGSLFGGRFVRNKIEKMFQFRHDVTKRECEKPVAGA
jgi:ligand-binding SRPBCC domain-containing protein